MTREMIRSDMGVEPSIALTVEDLAKWLGEQKWSGFAQSLSAWYDAKGYLTVKQEQSARSMWAKIQRLDAKTERVLKVSDPSDGFYRVDGTLYRVQKARQSDRRYAKVLTDVGQRSWQYVGREPFSLLTEAAKLTQADAEAHGLAYGWCLRCGRDLTDPVSVERGIGPVCVKYWGTREGK